MVITYHPDFALEPPYSLPCSARPAQHTLFDTHVEHATLLVLSWPTATHVRKGFRVSGFLPCVL